MQKVAVITGGGTGLGQAIAKQLAKRNHRVFVIGRRTHKLQETQRFYPDHIIPITADISVTQGRRYIKAFFKDISIDYLIHNAAIVFPIAPLEKITLTAFRKIQRTNLEAPLFLTQILMPKLNKNSRILHISSDCAHYPLAHWVPYCTSKAALFMGYECLKKELAEKFIAIGSIDPGMMDTPMQQAILEKEVQFPEKLTLEELQTQGLLFTPEFSAAQCVKLLLNTSIEFFQAKEHRVRSPLPDSGQHKT